MSTIFNKTGISKSYRNQVLGDAISINELRDRETNGKHLPDDQKHALRNFDRFRLAELNRQPDEEAFHARYVELQAMSNLMPYQEFLKEQYLTP